MESLTAHVRDGKLILEIDEHRFFSDALSNPTNNLSLVDRQQFLEFARRHIFTLTHDIDPSGEHPSWWRRLCEALAKTAAMTDGGVSERARLQPTCGCDPEEYDGG